MVMHWEDEMLVDTVVKMAVLLTLARSKKLKVSEIDVLVTQDDCTDDLCQVMQEAIDKSTRRGREVRRRIDAS